ncbi:AEC family transporter [Celeribacter halophilus]|uniref:Membrane transport protein n=1 Tax=Celeribacter halophilus TaxID=576117 RepID=A0A1I3VAW6_9RHOB|nr:AEC family transporter [Celeribacter halophilus]PZX09617.1 hypothetical protein LX82_02904 [Celeribacter halophilus]SFJ92508.1 hypothetical protein SAMN04488138_11461 [Celeribacter halophilus]
MLIELFDIVGPIMAITAIGYLLGRSSVEFQTRTLSNAVLLVATPCLIFSSLTALHVTFDTLREMASAALLCIGVAGALGLLALTLTQSPVRSYLPTLMMPNSGNMGIPLVVLTFGDSALALAVAYFFVVAIVQNTLGLAIYSGSFSAKSLLKQPLIYAVLAVLFVTWTGLTVPAVVSSTTEILGGMMVPSMLLLLGASLATLQVADLRPALIVSVGRLSIGLVTATIVISLLGLSGTVAGIVFLMATMPTAVLMFVFADRYQRNAKQVAGTVVVSTVMTLVCLPLLVWGGLKIAANGDEITQLRPMPQVVDTRPATKG